MCGIAGFFNNQVLDRSDLKLMTDSISHRGPDHEGFYVDMSSGTGLGHRRLSIIDLSPSGHQPMTYGISGLWITYNGEVFNFLEIRKELEVLGYKFRSESDTEVILAAYKKWGEEAFARFNGMWAFAIYDEPKKQIVLCRDRYGIKPLYYNYSKKNGLVFGSEYKVFRAISAKIPVSWDIRGVCTALEDPFRLESSGYSLLDGIKNLLPGHMLVANSNGITIRRWWDTMDHLVEVPSSFEQQAERFREIFESSCKLRLRSDVPLGTSLSGGLDSSSVVAMVNKVRGESSQGRVNSQRTFIHSFKDSPLDETQYAELVADSIGVEKHYVEVSSTSLPSEVDKIIRHFESIYPGMPDSPYRIYQAQRMNGVVVSLDGHGGDELMGGYHWYLDSAMQSEKIFSPYLWKLLLQQKNMLGEFASIRTTAMSLLRSRPLLRRLKKLLTKSPAKKNSYLKTEALDIELYDCPILLKQNVDPLTQVLYNDFHYQTLPRILRNFDLMSMANGVEVRMPLMDYRLVNFVFSLPSKSKIGSGYSKRILREAMSGLLPDEIRLRKTKIGFNSPMADWLSSELFDWANSTLSSHSFLADFLDISALRRSFNDRVRSDRPLSWEEATQFWLCISAVRMTQLCV